MSDIIFGALGEIFVQFVCALCADGPAGWARMDVLPKVLITVTLLVCIGGMVWSLFLFM